MMDGGQETAKKGLWTRENTCLFTFDGGQCISCTSRLRWARDEAEGSKKTRRLGRQRRASSIIRPRIPNHRTSAKLTDGTGRDGQGVAESQSVAVRSVTDGQQQLRTATQAKRHSSCFLPPCLYYVASPDRDPRLEPRLPGLQLGAVSTQAAGARDKIRDQPVTPSQPAQPETAVPCWTIPCRLPALQRRLLSCTWHMEIDHEILHQRLSKPSAINYCLPPFFPLSTAPSPRPVSSSSLSLALSSVAACGISLSCLGQPFPPGTDTLSSLILLLATRTLRHAVIPSCLSLPLSIRLGLIAFNGGRGLCSCPRIALATTQPKTEPVQQSLARCRRRR